ncbi:acyl carrier protein [Streptomyces sp. NPDC058525]|uniref:acyl carrier protein n=1 Tax=Streptomyces sp. NPDC058525 TaxID=3346538 RepID=UPI00364C8626
MDSNTVEEKARSAWEVALDDEVDSESDFLDAGGHSFMAMQIIATLEAELKTRIPLSLLYDNPKFSDFISVLVRHTAGTSD